MVISVDVGSFLHGDICLGGGREPVGMFNRLQGSLVRLDKRSISSITGVGMDVEDWASVVTGAPSMEGVDGRKWVRVQEQMGERGRRSVGTDSPVDELREVIEGVRPEGMIWDDWLLSRCLSLHSRIARSRVLLSFRPSRIP